MNKLNGLKVEKFRILKDAELKAIVGSGADGCGGNGYSNCYGSCFTILWPLNPSLKDHDYGTTSCAYNSSAGCYCPSL